MQLKQKDIYHGYTTNYDKSHLLEHCRIFYNPIDIYTIV